MSAPRRDLTSWKEIAEFLNVTERTAQRWERERKLPVCRPPGKRAMVYADPDQLRAWLEHESKVEVESASVSTGPPRSTRNRVLAGTVLLVVICGGVLGWRATRRRVPASARVVDEVLVAFDGENQPIWRHRFAGPLNADTYNRTVYLKRFSWVGDLDGDQIPEVLFGAVPAGPNAEPSGLYCFAADGRVLWTFSNQRGVSTPANRYDPPYVPASFAVLPPDSGDRDRRSRIVLLSNHFRYHPTQVALLDSTGKLLSEYWHSGHLYQVEVWNRGGRSIVLLGGINNAYQAATLIALHPDRVMGASVEEPGSRHQIQGFSPACERARLILPRTCISRATEPYNRVYQFRVLPAGFEVITRERIGYPLEPAVLYHFNNDFSLQRVGLEDTSRNVHRELEATGLLDHKFSEAEVDQLRHVRNVAPATCPR